MNTSRRLVGAALATAAASLFLANMPAATADEPSAVKIRCYGANQCKGQSECKTSMSDKGRNSCKGKGFVMMTEKDCVDTLGRR
ncbi:MAG TPA: hypothetical protein VFB20_17370 [Burkholderiales bacterium]|nr:hypothetical protein [Burkholderiales bacterium]